MHHEIAAGVYESLGDAMQDNGSAMQDNGSAMQDNGSAMQDNGSAMQDEEKGNRLYAAADLFPDSLFHISDFFTSS